MSAPSPTACVTTPDLRLAIARNLTRRQAAAMGAGDAGSKGVGNPNAANHDWCTFNTEECMYCGKNDWQSTFGPRTFIRCSCCVVKAMHVECHTKATGAVLDASILSSDAVLLCSKECEEAGASISSHVLMPQIYGRWSHLTGQRRPIKNESAEYSLEVVKYQQGDKSKVMMDNGRDLLEMVCQSYDSPPPGLTDEPTGLDRPPSQPPDGQAASAAVSRATRSRASPAEAGQKLAGGSAQGLAAGGDSTGIFGPHFAEMPFIATREGYRREGHCRRMVRAVEELLGALGVRLLVLPSIKSVLKMWTQKFGFSLITPHEHKMLQECEIVDMDPTTTHLIKKVVGAPGLAPPPARPKKTFSAPTLGCTAGSGAGLRALPTSGRPLPAPSPASGRPACPAAARKLVLGSKVGSAARLASVTPRSVPSAGSASNATGARAEDPDVEPTSYISSWEGRIPPPPDWGLHPEAAVLLGVPQGRLVVPWWSMWSKQDADAFVERHRGWRQGMQDALVRGPRQPAAGAAGERGAGVARGGSGSAVLRGLGLGAGVGLPHQDAVRLRRIKLAVMARREMRRSVVAAMTLAARCLGTGQARHQWRLLQGRGSQWQQLVLCRHRAASALPSSSTGYDSPPAGTARPQPLLLAKAQAASSCAAAGPTRGPAGVSEGAAGQGDAGRGPSPGSSGQEAGVLAAGAMAVDASMEGVGGLAEMDVVGFEPDDDDVAVDDLRAQNSLAFGLGFSDKHHQRVAARQGTLEDIFGSM
ncbi:hypothetical protein V8C86DRAFT_3025593 [Haematococcus lacustris]